MDAQDEQESTDILESQVLIPQMQDSITFHGKPIIVVRLPNGDSGVVLRWMCENLHITTKGQIERIKRTEVIVDDLVYARIQTDGGPQVLATLMLRSVSYWLATIDTRRMEKDDPRRQEILDYQRGAVGALYTWASTLRLETPAGLVSAEQVVKPITPEQGANLAEWQMYYEQMAAFTAWRISVEEWRGTVETRLGSIEALIPQIIEQLPPHTITPAHQNIVKYYISQLSKNTGKSPASIYSTLYTVFQVPRYTELREDEWNKVEEWFKKQLNQDYGGKRPEQDRLI